MTALQFLGTFQIGNGAAARCAGIGESGRECAAFLFQHPNRFFDRSELVEKFWSSEDTVGAKAALNSVASRLRRTLAASKGLQVEIRADKWSVGAYCEATDVTDTARLERIYHSLKNDGVDFAQATCELSDLYRGNFLPGHTSQWTHIERERLQALFVRSALRITDHLMRSGALDDAIDICRLVLTHDPLREAVHRRIMLIRAIKGESTKLRQHFANLQAFVKVECEADPGVRTQRLFAALCASAKTVDLQSLVAEELKQG